MMSLADSAFTSTPKRSISGKIPTNQPGGCHYSWASGPNAGYGFTQVRSDGLQPSLTEHRAAIRDFLFSINPATGYLD